MLKQIKGLHHVTSMAADARQSLALIGWFTAQGAAVESVIEAGGHEVGPRELAGLEAFLRAGSHRETLQ